MLELVHASTSPDWVDGRSFPEFIENAQERIGRLSKDAIANPSAIEQTLADIYAAEPRDPIGETYTSLLQLTSELYHGLLEEPLNASLQLEVLPQAPSGYPCNVSGGVADRSNEVMLTIYEAGFDLYALALVPRVLVHELVCHIGARHVGVWERTPKPDFRWFFSDGFMDCAAWKLLLTWLDGVSIADLTPVGHLSEADVPYASLRPDAFRAGKGAWSNCERATRLRIDPAPNGDRAQRRAASEDAVIRAAVRLNAWEHDIQPKDRFVHLARQPVEAVTQAFAEFAVGNAPPSNLLGDLDPPCE